MPTQAEVVRPLQLSIHFVATPALDARFQNHLERIVELPVAVGVDERVERAVRVVHPLHEAPQMRSAFDGSRQRAGQVPGERDEREERRPRDDKEAGDDQQRDDGLELARPAALEVLARAHVQAGALPGGAKEQRVGGTHDEHGQHEAHQGRVHVVPPCVGHMVVRQEAEQRAERGEQPHDNHHDVVEVDGHRAMADRRDDGETALEADGGELEDGRGAVEDVEGDVEEVQVQVAGHRVERVERVVRPQRDRYEADEEVAQG